MSMNEHQKREHEKARQTRTELVAIAGWLGWTLEPDAVSDNAPRSYWMTGPDGLEIRASVLWNDAARVEFSASEWPTHTDKNGETKRVTPNDMGNEWNGDSFEPRETAPTTTAARTRDPEAIAKQVAARIIPEYRRIYAALKEVAESRQVYADSEAETIDRLFEATQETRDGTRQKPYFIRNMPGGTMTIDYRSQGSILIELSCSDMCAVIAMLRERRQGFRA